jgi:DNA polymerase IV
MRLLNLTYYTKRVRNLAVSVYGLIPHQSEQLELFATKSHAVAEAMDKINDKYGEFVITPALMMGMRETIIDRIAFGGVKELEELYQQ